MTSREKRWNMACRFMDKVFFAIEHGDTEHRVWLKLKCEQMVSELDETLRQAGGISPDGPSFADDGF